jgi:hypothetical protein
MYSQYKTLQVSRETNPITMSSPQGSAIPHQIYAPSAYPRNNAPLLPELAPGSYQEFNSPASDAVEEAYLDIVVRSRSGSEDKDSNDEAAHRMQHEVSPYSADYEQQNMPPNEADVSATMSKRDMIWSYLRNGGNR